MNKKLLILLALAIVAIPMASACGRTTFKTGVPVAAAMNHPIDVRFENCNACHVADQLAAKPLPHTDANGNGLYTNAQCTQKGCHPLQGATTTTTTTTSTTTTTGGGTGTTTSSTGAPPPLTAAAVAITSHTAAQLTGYKGLCQMCHAQGLGNSNPYPPTWDAKASGSVKTTGVYTITAGSPADHTNYTVDQCTQAGCHAAPTS